MGLEKYYKGYRVQEANADSDVSPHDTNVDSPDWITVAVGHSAEKALKNLLSAMNTDDVCTDNNFYRLILPDDSVAKL